MPLKRLPAALALGLLASLIAHSALFGGSHAMGGAYHGALLETAFAGCAGLLGFIAALAWLGASTAADGSVLARRLASVLPGLPALTLATTAWFVLGERLEPAHSAAPALVVLGALLLAAWLLHRMALAAVAVLARAVLTIVTSPFAARVPSWLRIAAPAPLSRRSPVLRRRFARPPPVAFASPRA